MHNTDSLLRLDKSELVDIAKKIGEAARELRRSGAGTKHEYERLVDEHKEEQNLKTRLQQLLREEEAVELQTVEQIRSVGQVMQQTVLLGKQAEYLVDELQQLVYALEHGEEDHAREKAALLHHIQDTLGEIYRLRAHMEKIAVGMRETVHQEQVLERDVYGIRKSAKNLEDEGSLAEKISHKCLDELQAIESVVLKLQDAFRK